MDAKTVTIEGNAYTLAYTPIRSGDEMDAFIDPLRRDIPALERAIGDLEALYKAAPMAHEDLLPVIDKLHSKLAETRLKLWTAEHIEEIYPPADSDADRFTGDEDENVVPDIDPDVTELHEMARINGWTVDSYDLMAAPAWVNFKRPGMLSGIERYTRDYDGTWVFSARTK